MMGQSWWILVTVTSIHMMITAHEMESLPLEVLAVVGVACGLLNLLEGKSE